ncbi:MAG: DegT/DnrJ/EryC1/StrS family aminotransferase [Candidatus Omnitrophica bacterium]|nr:DegT/DnrJ/EryC1/StrS family aminotransferase [Candidatus Omnitrophota bacterium]MDD5591935.1 DegT/DnrJ/EryC1/StrS family aminotransferase [Candidatus Omnitrophota bacterium]
MIPILDLKKQITPIRVEIDSAIKKIIDNANFVFGKEIDEFEEKAAKYCRVKYAIGVSNGTDAIKLSLVALGIKPGDAVICPAFTYYASAGAIASMGAIPIFADINLDTYNISIDSIEKAIKQRRKQRIKAIVPVHLYGQCADMDGISKIAKKYKLKVVEDTAQAFGAEYKGKKAGTMGDCGAVSLFPAKNLGAFGDAGAVLTNNRVIAERLKIFRNQGNEEKYCHLVVGYNNRLDTIQAVILSVKIKYLDAWNKKRQENASYYNKQLQDLPVKTPFVPEYANHIYHQYVLRLDGPSKKLIEHLRNKGIDARVYYPTPLHLQKCFKYLGYKMGDFPESERASCQTLAIPVYPDLTKDEMDYIIASIKESFKKHCL